MKNLYVKYRQFLARNYKGYRNLKIIILFLIISLSYYYHYYYDFVAVICFMLFLLELKKWR